MRKCQIDFLVIHFHNEPDLILDVVGDCNLVTHIVHFGPCTCIDCYGFHVPNRLSAIEETRCFFNIKTKVACRNVEYHLFSTWASTR